jgi:tripartite-type tricarboxylate transporter receptor subunit TctC
MNIGIIAERAVVPAVLFALLLGALPTPATAQPYPNRPLKILVGSAPGSVPDTMIRPIAEQLSVLLGQPVIVDNKPGAAGIVAMEALRRAAPDGYTLALADMSQAVFNGYLFSKLPYDPQRDLEPIATLVTVALVLAANPAFPANSLAELVKVASAGGEKLFVAMPQTGSPPHVLGLLIQHTAGIEFTMVPYKAGIEAAAAAVAGEVPLVIEASTVIAPQVRAGKLKGLTVTGREREPSLPNTPTAIESGFADIQGEAWIGLVAPAGTAASKITRLNAALAEVLALSQMKDRMASLGFRTLVNGPEDFAKLMATERIKWSAVIRNANLRLD